jgi:magnesium and cobalt transporter|tara:strand:+ start:39008 stop:39841 length:834 start_codon:yes stop_codon:yes gene_type:complete
MFKSNKNIDLRKKLFSWFRETIESKNDIITLLDDSRKRDLLDIDEYRMIKGVLQVSEKHVGDIMIPRSHMVVLELDDEPKNLLEKIIDSGHSRFPVIGEDRDEIVGIFLAKDILKNFKKNDDLKNINISDLLRPAIFIPESKRLDTLLSQFRASRNHMAIVVDEYGGVSGLATIEDVLEQIVGDIDDEYDSKEDENIFDNGNGSYIVKALTRIEDFNDYFKSSLEEEDYDTVGGLIVNNLGRLPNLGELINYRGFNFKVIKSDKRRVSILEVSLQKK